MVSSMKFNKTEVMSVQIKGLVNLEGTRPSFSIDAICSTYLKTNPVLYGMLLIYGVGLSPKPLPYCRLNHKNRLILKPTWKKRAKAHFTALMATCCLLSCVDHGLSVYLRRGRRKWERARRTRESFCKSISNSYTREGHLLNRIK